MHGVHERGRGGDAQLLQIIRNLRRRADALSRVMPLQVR